MPLQLYRHNLQLVSAHLLQSSEALNHPGIMVVVPAGTGEEAERIIRGGIGKAAWGLPAQAVPIAIFSRNALFLFELYQKGGQLVFGVVCGRKGMEKRAELGLQADCGHERRGFYRLKICILDLLHLNLVLDMLNFV